MTVITEKSVSFAYGRHGFRLQTLSMYVRFIFSLLLELPAFRFLDGDVCNNRMVAIRCTIEVAVPNHLHSSIVFLWSFDVLAADSKSLY